MHSVQFLAADQDPTWIEKLASQIEPYTIIVTGILAVIAPLYARTLNVQGLLKRVKEIDQLLEYVDEQPKELQREYKLNLRVKRRKLTARAINLTAVPPIEIGWIALQSYIPMLIWWVVAMIWDPSTWVEAGITVVVWILLVLNIARISKRYLEEKERERKQIENAEQDDEPKQIENEEE